MPGLTAAASLMEAVPLPLVLIGDDDRVAAMNAGARRLFGATLIGRHYGTALRQPALVDCVETVLARREAGRARYLAREARRDTAWSVTVTPVELRAWSGALATLEDVTAADEADRMRRDFVANVSHELRTPLTAVLGFVETLRGAARDDPSTRERFLAIMAKEAERMNRLVDDLLSLSRFEREERVLPTASVDIGGVLASVISSLRPGAEDRGVRIVQSGPDAPLRLRGDADQLFQVFANLIENAIKYGRQGGEITITVTAAERDPLLRGSAARVAVHDDGPGIDPIHIPRLTERFYRIDAHRSRELGGTGLGLAIVKHIVSRHRGHLRIDSAPGRGSTFTVVLPIAGGTTKAGSDVVTG